MATIKGIKGIKVQSLTSDPTASEAAGQLWYNTTSSALKYAIEGAGSWASSNPMNQGRGQFGLTGIVTAALAFAGSPAQKTNTEEYDGTSWTNKNSFKYWSTVQRGIWNLNSCYECRRCNTGWK